MRIHEIGGEFGLIERLRGAHAGAAGDGLIVPIGDDAAVLDIPVGHQCVVTTDMLIEGVHFRRDWSDPYSIGWKAVAVNLSDIAAMGASPAFAFVSLALGPLDTVEVLDRLYDGLADALNRYGARLAGGDTNATPDNLVVSVTQTGTVESGTAWTRGGGRVGDVLLVTGTLGDSALGLELLTRHGLAGAEKKSRALVSAHRRPQPRIVAARAAHATGKVRAAMDLSDGLAGDLPKLCAASKCGATVETVRLPVSDELRRVASELGLDPLALALSGGEDLELLLAVAPDDIAEVQAAIESVGVSITRIGEFVKTGMRFLAPDGSEMPAAGQGWDHFSA